MISVIMTTFNRREQLEKNLWSIFEYGEVKPDEACIIDDASTDGTWNYLVEMKKRYPLKIFYRERGDAKWANPSIPRNMAVRMASRDSKYLWFLEPEMLLPKLTLAKMLRHFETPTNSWVNAVQQGFVSRPLTWEEAHKPEETWRENYVFRDPHPHLAVRCALVPYEAVYAVTGYPEYCEGWGADDTGFMTQLRVYGCAAINDFDINVLHQWHERAPATAHTADRNQAIMQEFDRRGIYAVNGDNWGTDGGRYLFFKDYNKE